MKPFNRKLRILECLVEELQKKYNMLTILLKNVIQIS